MAHRSQEFRRLFESAPNGVLVVDPDGRIILVNDQIETLFGYSRDELIGREVECLLPERFRDAHPVLRHQFHESPQTRPMGAGRDLAGLRKDGTEFIFEIGLSPFHSEGQQLVMVSVVDITARKLQEDKINLVTRELAHRSKNLLAVIIAIARQTMKESPELGAFKETFEGRLLSIDQSEELLLKKNWEGVSVADLVDAQLKPYMDAPARIECSGPPILLKPDLAQRLGLALHELATNATKFGALSSPTGKVVVRWEFDDRSGQFRFSWTEKGGPRVTPPERRGFRI